MNQQNNILDAPSPKSNNTAYKWLRGIAVGLEIAIWLLLGSMAALFKLESWEGGSLLLILFCTTLGLLYLFFTFLITGAKGKERLLIAIGVGVTLFLHLVASMFTIESWEFGKEILVLSYILGLAAIGSSVYYLVQSRKAGASISFYVNILVRLLLVFLLV